MEPPSDVFTKTNSPRVAIQLLTGPFTRRFFRRIVLPRLRRGRRSAGSRGRRSGRSASCGRGRAGAGSWRAGRGGGPCSRRRSSRSRRSRRSEMPAFTPPPASHIVKPCGLWSRPSLPWAAGVRPNSPPQRTSVSFEQAAALQVASAGRRSACRPRGRCWRGRASGCRAGPTCSCACTCTKRTPASAKRRAIRHCRPKFVGRRVVEAVQLLRRRRSRSTRSCTVRGGGLHAEGQLERVDAAFERRVGAGRRQVLAVRARRAGRAPAAAASARRGRRSMNGIVDLTRTTCRRCRAASPGRPPGRNADE